MEWEKPGVGGEKGGNRQSKNLPKLGREKKKRKKKINPKKRTCENPVKEVKKGK